MSVDEVVTTPRIKITLTKGPSVTVAVLEMLDEYSSTVHTITGEARRHPRDVENRHIGDMYALGRAFKTLSDDMLTWADSEVEIASRSYTVGSLMHEIIKDAIARGDTL